MFGVTAVLFKINEPSLTEILLRGTSVTEAHTIACFSASVDSRKHDCV